MAVQLKLICRSKEHNSNTPDEGNIHLVGDTNANEYFKYTPYADLQMGLLNPLAFSQFEPGKTYLVTIEESNDE